MSKEKYFINCLFIIYFTFLTSPLIAGNGVLKFAQQAIQLGKVDASIEYKISIPIKNIGTDTLKLLRVSTDCGCSSAKFSSNALAVGEEAILSVNFKPTIGETPFYRSIIVLTDSKIPQYTVTLEGEIANTKKEVSISEEVAINWKDSQKSIPILSAYSLKVKGRENELRTIPLYISNLGEKALIIESFDMKGLRIETIQLPRTIPKGYIMSLPLKIDFSDIGNQLHYLKINTDERTLMFRLQTVVND
ncbi:DUF1573 domain-containing protein [Flammeovirga pectinis]|uniref:DUF1573 domain-containing protein n=1 Tax=Flammeovirga pectinis TaxID=2494373 RepID=A0A3S9P2P6_9BACT|nr:DUF1573 domain-containing protein [Flammeovirga pectinis]AZQ62481.1 DUF1573 domain-containing protein [Flammeovirga pectinis]